MKPKRIILIRHGESQANVDKTLYGSIPDYTIELTDTGREQAREAGKRLKELVGNESMYFYVSPFWRARSTFEGVVSAFPRSQQEKMKTLPLLVCICALSACFSVSIPPSNFYSYVSVTFGMYI